VGAAHSVIEIIKGLPRNVVGIAVKGRVTMRDCREILIPAMEKRLKRHDKIRLYYELGSRFPGAGWDDLDLGIERAVRCERVAIVTDIGWVRLTVKALGFLIPGEIRVFATIQVLEARAWIAARTSIETFAPVARSRRMRRVPPVRSQLPRDTEQTDAPNYVGRQQHAIQQILS
jgi:stage II sporulation SpoAA-like protein